MLTCYGGAAPQHACALARALGVRGVLVHKSAGVMGAQGLFLGNHIREAYAPVHVILAADRFDDLATALTDLASESCAKLAAAGVSADKHHVLLFVRLRCASDAATGPTISVPLIADADERAKWVAANGSVRTWPPAADECEGYTPLSTRPRVVAVGAAAPAILNSGAMPVADASSVATVAAMLGDLATTFTCRYKHEYGVAPRDGEALVVVGLRARGTPPPPVAPHSLCSFVPVVHLADGCLSTPPPPLVVPAVGLRRHDPSAERVPPPSWQPLPMEVADVYVGA